MRRRERTSTREEVRWLSFVELLTKATSFPEAVEDADTGALFGFSIATIVLLALISLTVAGGIGLIKGKSWGRTLAMVNAVLDLFSIPIGTIIGVLTLIYLFRQEVKEYFATAQN